MSESGPLESVIDDLEDQARDADVSVGSLVGAFSDRSLGPLVSVFGLAALIPVIGGLPGAPAVIAVLLLGSIAQGFTGHGGIWLPRFVREREVSSQKLRRSLEWARPWADRIDRLTSHRLEPLVATRPARLVILACLVGLALSLFPLGLIPAGIAPAAAAILIFGLALMARDGLLALIGYALTAAAVWAMLMLL